MDSISFIAAETGIAQKQIASTIKLLDDGATIPFISRYRKEATQGLDEVQIQSIAAAYEKAKELKKRKEFIIETISQQNKLTDSLRQQIENCFDGNVLEDIYLPFKPKRRTKAETARENGLEPLAKMGIGESVRARNCTQGILFRSGVEL